MGWLCLDLLWELDLPAMGRVAALFRKAAPCIAGKAGSHRGKAVRPRG